MAATASSGLVSALSLLFVTTSLFFFIGKNLIFSGWDSSSSATTPLRWVSATVVPVIAVSWGHQRRALSTTGALLALLVGFCLSLAHYSFFLALLAFFISSSKAVRYRHLVTQSGGQEAPRTWLQVLCHGVMATILSLLYVLDVGSADLPVDFRHHYRASWLGVTTLAPAPSSLPHLSLLALPSSRLPFLLPPPLPPPLLPPGGGAGSGGLL
jgi:hypothetical protein